MKLHSNITDDQFQGEVYCLNDGYLVQGTTYGTGTKVRYWAANSPDSHLSLTGTALPFPNREVAFNPSMNVGNVVSDDRGRISFQITHPNSYYTCTGRQLIPPHLNFAIDFGNGQEKLYYVPLNNGYRSRSLTNLPGRPNRSTGR